VRWAEHIASTGNVTNAYEVLIGNPEGGDHVEDIGINGRIILN
jgi:hypothetical protein